MTKSEELAQFVIDRCLRRGVSEFVLCPGSRNSPLILEVLRRDLPRWSFADERAAGFFALGRSRALDAPVAVCTTSGTAVAELYPAVVEALYQRAPLLCVTADRPAVFRGSGAPQAIEQRGLFCLYTTDSWDAEGKDFDLDRWDGYGPAHLNVCLSEPLLSERRSRRGGAGADGPEQPPPAPEPDTFRERTIPGPDLILLGALPRARREEVARRLAAWRCCPVLADAASGLREHPDLEPFMLRGGERGLDASGFRVVLRIGGVPSFRLWRDLEDLPGVTVYSVLANGFSGLARESLMLPGWERLELEASSGDPALLEADRKRETVLRDLLHRFPGSEPALVRRLAQKIPRAARVFLGNSLPIREWNLAAPFEDRRHEMWANRGANGIDGNLSSFFGLTADAGESWGLFGDLTTVYDLNAPWIMGQLPPGKRRIVVINNGGGRIFARLPGMGGLAAASRRITESEHDLKFDHWAAMWDLDYASWSGGAWPRLKQEAVIEVFPDPEQTEAFWEAWQDADA